MSEDPLTYNDPLTQNSWPPEHPDFPRADWRDEVAAGDTLLGYQDWVNNQRRDTIVTAIAREAGTPHALAYTVKTNEPCNLTEIAEAIALAVERYDDLGGDPAELAKNLIIDLVFKGESEVLHS